MKLRLRRPREFALRLRAVARRSPEAVQEYLDTHGEAWEALAEADPHDAADILEELGEEAATELLTELDPEEGADVLEEMHPILAAEVVAAMPTEEAVRYLAEMAPDEAADILGTLEPDDRSRIMAALPRPFAVEVRRLLEYPPDAAGGLMTTQVAALPVGMTAGEAIERIRQLHDEYEDLSYVYVTDDDGRLLGVISFRDLVFARPLAGLDEVMVPNPIAVGPYVDREQVAELIERYNLLGLPVVDEEGRLLGMVDHEAVIDAVRQEASEDFAAAMGAGTEETVHTPIRRSIRARLPWILMDLGFGYLVASVISYFHPIIERETVLASLMPLIARVGGDSGAQSLAVVIRALAVGDVPPGRVREVIGREVAIGFVNGLVFSALAGLIATTLQGPDIGLVVFIASWANLIVAGFAGSGIPILLRKLGLDPALASNLMLTTVTDLLGFGGFLAVAMLLL